MVFPSHMFQPPCTAFFPPLSEPISFSSFYLTTPLFAHFSIICLKWPHLPPLILFAPHLTFSFSSLALSFITCICPSSVYFVLKFNNFFTPFIYSSSYFFTLSNYFSCYLLPIWKYSSAPPLGISHSLNLSSYSLFILHSSVYRIFAAFIHTSNAVALSLPSELISISADLQQTFRPLLIYICFKLDNL